MNFLSDLKVGFRQITKSPGNTLLAVLAYSVGLGLVGLILTLHFGVVRAHPKDMDFEKIQWLNWDESTRHLWKQGFQAKELRIQDFYEIHEQQNVFAKLAATKPSTFNIVVSKFAERYTGEYVTSEYFDVLEVSPYRGQFFQQGDDSPEAPAKAVISYRFWRDDLGAKENAIGKSLAINGIPTTIIGIAKEGFDFPAENDLWINLRVDPVATLRTEGDVYSVLGHLRPNVTVTSAITELDTIAKQLSEKYPETNTGFIAIQIRSLSSVYLDDMSSMVYLLFASACLVLLIACANVANLTLSRATTRIKELAIRSSLGGQRKRIVTQMLIEGAILATFGGITGLIVTIWSAKAIWHWIGTFDDASRVPTWMNMDADFRVIASLAFITLLASVFSSIVPALQASKTNVNDILKDKAHGSTGLKIGKFSRLLALSQIAISGGMLIATTGLVTTARETSKFDPTYETNDMIIARFDFPGDRYVNNRADFLRRLQQSFEQRDGISNVGFTTAHDMIFNWYSRWELHHKPVDNPSDYTPGRQEIVSDNYFDILGIPVLYGRNFDTIDAAANAQPTCIINEPLANIISPGDPQGALGKQIRDSWDPTNPWLSIVGIVPDTRMSGPGPHEIDELAGVFRPMSQSPQASLTIFARVVGDPYAGARQIQTTLREQDETIALYRVKTLESAVTESNFETIFVRNMFGIFGIAALALSSIGVYGVMSFSVRQRFQEFAIRQALGAKRSTILKHIARSGTTQIGVGLFASLLVGWVLTLLVGSLFSGSFVHSPINYLIPTLVLASISALALYSPSRYATKANLANSLRVD